MTIATSAPKPIQRPAPGDDLLLREANHRSTNDLQFVVGLLALQHRRARGDEARRVLNDAMERVGVIARARSAMNREVHETLAAALAQVCDALRSQAEPRGILIVLRTARDAVGLSMKQVTTLALVVNELATSAIKHAFEHDKGGVITIAVDGDAAGNTVVTVDDDGLPFPDPSAPKGDGLGLGLARRLMASIDGLLIAPTGPAKLFELRVPASAG